MSKNFPSNRNDYFDFIQKPNNFHEKTKREIFRQIAMFALILLSFKIIFTRKAADRVECGIRRIVIDADDLQK